MVSLLEERIKVQDRASMTALIIADYYEIVKELLTALMLSEGFKTLSHKELIDYAKTYPEFTGQEISLLDELRILRNRVAYEGFVVEPSYLRRCESSFRQIIGKLLILMRKKL